jgi:hypothetical protein
MVDGLVSAEGFRGGGHRDRVGAIQPSQIIGSAFSVSKCSKRVRISSNLYKFSSQKWRFSVNFTNLVIYRQFPQKLIDRLSLLAL